jgi:hypothetical protein
VSGTYAVVRWRSSVDPVAEARAEMTWGKMCEMLAPGADQWLRYESKADIPGWSPVALRAGEDGVYRRRAALVDTVSCLVLDLDAGDSAEAVVGALHGLAACVHTTWSYTEEHPKFRAVIPFDVPCLMRWWSVVWSCAARWATSRGVRPDPATKDPCRLYYLPAWPPSGLAMSRCLEGEPLSWRRLMADYPAPTVAPVPFSSRRQINQRGLDSMEGGDRARAERYLGGVERGLSATAEGGRNAGAFRAGAALGGLIAAGTASDAVWRGRLVGAAMATGLDQREAEAAIDNGITRGTTDGRALADRE